MRLSPAVALALVALSGCGADEGAPGSAGADCVQTLLWRGATYFPDNIPVAGSNAVGRGVLPACEESEDREVALVRLPRTPPRVALGVRGRRDAWLAEGFPVELAGHPLHAKAYGPGKPARMKSCRRRERLVGRVAVAPAPARPLRIANGGGRTPVRLHAKTTVAGLRRAGVPYLPEGARVVADVRRCGTSTTVVADALRLGG